MIKTGEKLPAELRQALSLFLKTADYHVLATKDGIKSGYTIRNMMQGVAQVNEEGSDTAQLLVDYGLEKAKDQIEKLKNAMAVIEQYASKKEVAA